MVQYSACSQTSNLALYISIQVTYYICVIISTRIWLGLGFSLGWESGFGLALRFHKSCFIWYPHQTWARAYLHTIQSGFWWHKYPVQPPLVAPLGSTRSQEVHFISHAHTDSAHSQSCFKSQKLIDVAKRLRPDRSQVSHIKTTGSHNATIDQTLKKMKQ